MKTYKIVIRTNAYLARKDSQFKGGKTENVLLYGLSLKDARKVLLEYYNDKYECERPFAPNWGIAVIQSKKHAFGAVKTFQDGTRTFDYDSKAYTIEEEGGGL